MSAATVTKDPTPIRSTLLGSEFANDELSVGYHFRRKRCYELAGWTLLFGDAPEGTVMVHGTMDGHEKGNGLGRIGHAWLVLPDGTIWEPIFGDVWDAADWTAYADAREERRYTREQAFKKMLRHEHYGRWHTSRFP